MMIDLLLVTLTVVMVAVVLFGVSKQNAALTLRVGIALTVWLTFTAVLARSGVFEVFTAPPRLVAVPVTVFVTMLLLFRTTALRQLVLATPLHWLIGVQVFRIVVELLLWGLYETSRAPVQITFEGRNFDVLVGLTAPVMAWLVAGKRVSTRVVIAWNVVSLLVLANTIGTVLSSIPGPLHHDWPGSPFVEVARFPFIWLPGFLAPLAIFLHVASLRRATSGS